MTKIKDAILVLGVGNILLHDEGIGVHIVRELEENYVFSQNVTLLDGGTLGMRLIDSISRADMMIVADTLCSGKKPGTITRLTGKEITDRIAAKNSMHQVSFQETLTYADLLDCLPETVLIGCEPEDLSSWGMNLSPQVEAVRRKMIRMLIQEIEIHGGTVTLSPQ